MNVNLFLFLQVYVDNLVKKAYENWNHVIEYDGKSLLNFKQVRRSARNEPQTGALGYSYAIDHQLQLPQLPVTISSEQPSADSRLPVGGFVAKLRCLYFLAPVSRSMSLIRWNNQPSEASGLLISSY